MRRRSLFAFAVAAPLWSAAQTELAAESAEKERALAAIKKWRGFDGAWEADVNYVAAPKEYWSKQSQSLRVEVTAKEVKAFLRPANDWHELGTTYQATRPDELTLVIHAYRAGGVWTENHVIILTRRTENEADVFLQRVVNNWVHKSLPGQDYVYGDTRTGKATRR